MFKIVFILGWEGRLVFCFDFGEVLNAGCHSHLNYFCLWLQQWLFQIQSKYAMFCSAMNRLPFCSGNPKKDEMYWRSYNYSKIFKNYNKKGGCSGPSRGARAQWMSSGPQVQNLLVYRLSYSQILISMTAVAAGMLMQSKHLPSWTTFTLGESQCNIFPWVIQNSGNRNRPDIKQ